MARPPQFVVDLTSLPQLEARPDIMPESLKALRSMLSRPVYRENQDMMAQSLTRTARISCSLEQLLESGSATIHLSSLIPQQDFYPSELGLSAEATAARYDLKYSVVTELLIEEVRYSSPVNLLLHCSSQEVMMKHLELTQASLDREYMQRVRQEGGRAHFALLPYYPMEPAEPALRASPLDGLRAWSETTGGRKVSLRQPTAYILDDSLQYYAGCGLMGPDISRGCVEQLDPSQACGYTFVGTNSSLAAMLCTYHSILGAELRCSLQPEELEDRSHLLLRLPSSAVRMAEDVATSLLFNKIPYENPKEIQFRVQMWKPDELKRMSDGTLLRRDMSQVDPKAAITVTIKFCLRYMVLNADRRAGGQAVLQGHYIALGGREHNQLQRHPWMAYGQLLEEVVVEGKNEETMQTDQ